MNNGYLDEANRTMSRMTAEVHGSTNSNRSKNGWYNATCPLESGEHPNLK